MRSHTSKFANFVHAGKGKRKVIGVKRNEIYKGKKLLAFKKSVSTARTTSGSKKHYKSTMLTMKTNALSIASEVQSE